ncbi:helix-turn-helix domain-containing protein [Streptomyces sp. NPDC002088]|uniref:winged helix-turn-helix transcriptional regulator n=1 Tax=Streptomyces sp. NPDC002088 TaxID=3154665 RepID=UPI003318A20E
MSETPQSPPVDTREAIRCQEAAHLRSGFDVLGKRWNGLVLAALSSAPLGFADLSRVLPDLSERMLSSRLQELAAAGLVARTVDPGPPVRSRYTLSTSGQAAVPVLRVIATWAATHLSAIDVTAEAARDGSPGAPGPSSSGTARSAAPRQ